MERAREMGGEGVRQSLIMSWVGEICTVTAVARGFDLFLYFYKAPEDTSAVSSTTQEMEKRVSHNINGHVLCAPVKPRSPYPKSSTKNITMLGFSVAGRALVSATLHPRSKAKGCMLC